MAGSTNTYDAVSSGANTSGSDTSGAGKASITLKTMNDLPDASGDKHYVPIDPATSGRASLYARIKIL